MRPITKFLIQVTTFTTPTAAPLRMFCMEGSRVFLIQASRLASRLS